LLDAITGRADLLQLRGFQLALPEDPSTTRLLSLSLDTSVEEFRWLLQEQCLSEARRVQMLYSLLERANDNILGRLARSNDFIEGMLSVITTPPPSALPLHAYLKLLAWSNISIDRVLYVALPALEEVRGHLRSELFADLIAKALRFADASSNQALYEMIADDGCVVNPDYLIANAVSSESSPARISDNLIILDRVPATVRHEILRQIDNLSFRLIQNHPDRLSDEGIGAWSRLIADSGEINPAGQLRAAGSSLTFALSQRTLNVSPLLVVSFPVVYRQQKQGTEEPSIWSILRSDWDRCKTLRSEIAASFLRSVWPPSDLLKASLPTGDLERILSTLSKYEGGEAYLRRLSLDITDLAQADQKRVSKIVEQALSGEHR
jgi:hypothetical protein